MVDYAESVVKNGSATQAQEKGKTAAASVEIPFSRVGFAIIVAVLIYILGYQNSTIAHVKHSINLKKSKLLELRIQMDSLKTDRARVLNSGSIVADSKARNMEIAKNIQIVY